MDKLTIYMDLQKDIFNYFGFVPDWVVPPIDDKRDMYWRIIGSETSGSVQYATEKEHIEDDTGEQYEASIYTQRFYDKWVYRGKDYTMIMIDTHTDGNKFLSIFTNAKEI